MHRLLLGASDIAWLTKPAREKSDSNAPAHDRFPFEICNPVTTTLDISIVDPNQTDGGIESDFV
jgi:hypothetical protein